MTTEDDFHAALDANPEDHQTRLVFADWLQKRDDPRAEGYRALGVLGKQPSQRTEEKDWFVGTEDAPSFGPGRDESYIRAQFPPDWWTLVGSGDPWGPGQSTNTWRFFPTRREAEDAAALAFAKLPPERRAELLAGTTAARKPKGNK